jgi:glycosyltransferase involved in cell wall biosynthesis
MRKRRIGIPVTGFVGWGGGIDFIKMVIRGVLATQKYEVIILLPEEASKKDKLKNNAKKILNFLALPLSVVGVKKNPFATKAYKNYTALFKEFNQDLAKSVAYHHTHKYFKKTLKQQKIDILGPCISAQEKDLPVPWIGYLYDFQHKYLPQFFSAADINDREGHFARMVHGAGNIIVNSLSVKNDIHKFYPEAQSKITALPFTPLFNKRLLTGDFDAIKEKYDLPDSYFIISNQFWQHKDHLTAFRALQIVTSTLTQQIAIVCTGETGDYRQADYFTSLKKEIQQLGIEDKVYFLGYISKQDQIQILLHSVALVQPTLFEGGPGGGATYDAIAFSKPAIISDIAINKEISNPLVTFFQAGNHADLADKMSQAIQQEKNTPVEIDTQQLERETQERIKLLGNALANLIDSI